MHPPHLGELRYLITFYHQKMESDTEASPSIRWQKAFSTAAKIIPISPSAPTLYWQGQQVIHPPHYRVWVRQGYDLKQPLRIVWRTGFYSPLPPLIDCSTTPWTTFLMKEIHAL